MPVEGVALNTCRNALEYIILQLADVKRIYVPYYTCEAVIEPLKRLPVEYEFYRINEQLEMAEEFVLHDGDYLIANNYFGVKDAYVAKLADKYSTRLIIDNAQALFAPILPGIRAVYSTRKFVGVADGGFAEDSSNYYKLDITDYKAVECFVKSMQSELNQIKLINCAGISYSGFAHKADIEEWQKVIQVNLFGAFNIIRALLPIMREQNYGRIINFSSVVAVSPTSGVSAYAASKAGLIGLTKTLAVENASKGITVNAINLGYVSMGMGVEAVPFAFQEKMRNRIPIGRFCNPEEIYITVKYLLETEYITGADLNINGGIV